MVSSTSEAGRSFLMNEEGRSLKAYPDGGGYSICYGHWGVDANATATATECETLLENDLKAWERNLNNHRLNINQSQYDALISLSYNIGQSAFNNSTLLSKIKANPNDSSIANEFAKWNKSQGIISPVLVGRRQREADLYFSSRTAIRVASTLGLGLLLIGFGIYSVMVIRKKQQ